MLRQLRATDALLAVQTLVNASIIDPPPLYTSTRGKSEICKSKFANNNSNAESVFPASYSHRGSPGHPLSNLKTVWEASARPCSETFGGGVLFTVPDATAQ